MAENSWFGCGGASRARSVPIFYAYYETEWLMHQGKWMPRSESASLFAI